MSATFDLPDELLKRAKIAAAERGVTLRELIESAVAKDLAVAVLEPVEEEAEARWAWELVRAGAASWGGGKPKGSADPPKVRGKTASEIVLEDRR